MRCAHDARCAVDRSAEEIVVAALGDARVQPAADANRNAVGRLGIRERPLQLQRCTNCIERVRKGGMHAIAAHFHDVAAIMLHGSPDEHVVTRQGRPHPLGILLP